MKETSEIQCTCTGARVSSISGRRSAKKPRNRIFSRGRGAKVRVRSAGVLDFRKREREGYRTDGQRRSERARGGGERERRRTKDRERKKEKEQNSGRGQPCSPSIR